MINRIHGLVIMTLMGSYMGALHAQKSVVPDINAKGQKGEIARKMLAKSSHQFLRADTNHDYRISTEEASQHLIFISRKFSLYDKNNDQNLSWQEYLGHDEWPVPVHKNMSAGK